MIVIDLKIPTGWHELTQEQLRMVLDVIAAYGEAYVHAPFLSEDDYASQIYAMTAIHITANLNDFRVVCPYGDGWLIDFSDEDCPVDAEQLASVISNLAWLKNIPSVPVRLDFIGDDAAITPDIVSELSFGDWLACDNYWQYYQTDRKDDHLRSIGELLYPNANRDEMVCTPGEILNVFYWFASVKQIVSSKFPTFFRSASNPNGSRTHDVDDMRRSVDAQIRALTKGDITKEDQVLNMPALRALTELDALAREYEELNKKYHGKK